MPRYAYKPPRSLASSPSSNRGGFLCTCSLLDEFADFDEAQQRCHEAWNQALNQVEIEGPENRERMAYTSLYTMYVNIIDGGRASCYSEYYSRPRSLASSAYRQFIGGFQSCCWGNFRTAYPFLMLGYPGRV